MVSADKAHAVRVPNLECKEQQERLDGVKAAVNEVAHEQVVSARALASNLEEFHQVVELTVNVSADL